MFAFARGKCGEEVELLVRVGGLGERGCGWVALLPAAMPVCAAAVSYSAEAVDLEESELIRWAKMRVEARDTGAADAWAAATIAAMSEGGGFFEAVGFGPAKTQWSAILRERGRAKLRPEHGWNANGRDSGSWQPLREWFQERLRELEGLSLPRRLEDSALQHVVDHARRTAPESKERSE